MKSPLTTNTPLVRHLQIATDPVHRRKRVQLLPHVLPKHAEGNGVLQRVLHRLHDVLLLHQVDLLRPLLWRLVVVERQELLTDLLAVHRTLLQVHEYHALQLVLRARELLVARRLAHQTADVVAQNLRRRRHVRQRNQTYSVNSPNERYIGA